VVVPSGHVGRDLFLKTMGLQHEGKGTGPHILISIHPYDDGFARFTLCNECFFKVFLHGLDDFSIVALFSEIFLLLGVDSEGAFLFSHGTYPFTWHV
jgi:hypothetical protein